MQGLETNIICCNFLVIVESAVHGCIATTDATGAQVLWKEGESSVAY